MKVELIRDGLLIVPETDFEIAYLRQFYHPKGVAAFLKHGVSVAEVVGVKVIFPPDVITPIVPVELEVDGVEIAT